MKKTPCYLWRNDYPSQKEYEDAKEQYAKPGFRVVTFKEGQAEPVLEGIKAVIKNHIERM